MYSYITGILTEMKPDRIVVENSGIGYNISIPSRILSLLPGIGEKVKIYTYLNVREDCFNLFGFLTPDELEIFKLLINVSGIGPKGGLAVLSYLSPDDLRFAILSEDVKAISQAPGIGAKTAKRLIIELKDKIDIEDTLSAPEGSVSAVSDAGQAGRDALEALTALGYSASEAAKVLSGIDITPESTAEDILKSALKELAFM